MFLDHKLQVDFSTTGVNSRSLPSVDVNGPFCLDLTTFESTSLVVPFARPLQAKPFIAKVPGRPSEKIRASYGFKKALVLLWASGSLQHSASTCSFALRRGLRFPSLPDSISALPFKSL
jgi:hypothetical protein